MRIAIVPSDQGGVEQPLCVPIARECSDRLHAVYGVDAKLFTNTTPTNDYVTLTKQVNTWAADYMVNVHSNADGQSKRVNGIMGLCYSDKTRAWVGKICETLAASTGMVYEGTRTPAEIGRGSLYVLSSSAMPSAIVEIGAWDVPAELAALQKRIPELGQKLADAVAVSLGLKSSAPLQQPSSLSGLFEGRILPDGSRDYDWELPVTRGQLDRVLARLIGKVKAGEL